MTAVGILGVECCCHQCLPSRYSGTGEARLGWTGLDCMVQHTLHPFPHFSRSGEAGRGWAGPGQAAQYSMPRLLPLLVLERLGWAGLSWAMQHGVPSSGAGGTVASACTCSPHHGWKGEHVSRILPHLPGGGEEKGLQACLPQPCLHRLPMVLLNDTLLICPSSSYNPPSLQPPTCLQVLHISDLNNTGQYQTFS